VSFFKVSNFCRKKIGRYKNCESSSRRKIASLSLLKIMKGSKKRRESASQNRLGVNSKEKLASTRKPAQIYSKRS